MFQNINSSVSKINCGAVVEECERHLTKTLVQSVKCYLVDPELMDRISPPTAWITGKEYIKQKLERFFEERIDTESLDKFWKEIPKEKIGGVIENLGVFLIVDDRLQQEIEQYANRKIEKGPSIFICPERIEDRAMGKDVRSFYQMVIAHEFGHAFIRLKGNGITDKYYKTDWGRIIEEGLCQAFGLLLASPAEDCIDFTERQPLEYQTWRLWDRNIEFIKLMMGEWSINEIPKFPFPWWYGYPFRWWWIKWWEWYYDKIRIRKAEDFWKWLAIVIMDYVCR